MANIKKEAVFGAVLCESDSKYVSSKKKSIPMTFYSLMPNEYTLIRRHQLKAYERDLMCDGVSTKKAIY